MLLDSATAAAACVPKVSAANAPLVANGTRTGRGDSLLSALKGNKTGAHASRATDNSTQGSPASVIGHDKLVTLEIGDKKIQVAQLPPMTADPTLRATAFDSVVTSLEHCSDDFHARALTLSKYLSDVTHDVGAKQNVKEVVMEFEQELFSVANFTNAHFLDGYGNPRMGALSENPNDRPDNIKFVHVQSHVDMSKSRTAASLPKLAPFLTSFALSLRDHQVFPTQAEDGWTLPDTPTTTLPATFAAGAGYTTPLLNRSGRKLPRAVAMAPPGEVVDPAVANPFPEGTYGGHVGLIDHQSTLR